MAVNVNRTRIHIPMAESLLAEQAVRIAGASRANGL